jgi:uncharacterized BrkB/YihY/UPF0761 family membrane protein
VRRLIEIFRRSFQRFLVLEGFDRSMALAGQAFAALLPLLIVVSAVSPTSGEDAASAIIDRLELKGSSAAVVRQAVAQPDAVRNGFSLLGILILTISALAFTRALQRLFVKAWELDKLGGVRGNVWGLYWPLAFCCFWLLQPLVVGVFDGATASGSRWPARARSGCSRPGCCWGG